MDAPQTLPTCRQCGSELPAGSAYCNRCGASQLDERPAKPLHTAPAGAPPPEETLWTGSHSLKADVHLWILWALWIALVLALYLRYMTTPTTATNLGVCALAVGPALWSLGRALVHKFGLRYRLSNHRLFTERGLFSRRLDELELIRVDDVSVRQNLLARLFDVGTVTVISTDATNPKIEIEGIARPLELKELIRTQVRARRARTTFLETL